MITENKAILDGKTIVPVDDFAVWGKWFETANRHVAKTDAGGILISTVFLGMNHNFGDGCPLWFETMIFGGEHDGYQERYSTWDEAEAGHKSALKMAGIE